MTATATPSATISVSSATATAAPDMRNPIELALYEFNKEFRTYTAKSLGQFKKYHFCDFDISRYPVIKWAEKVINEKGTYGAVFNAANEVAVHAFLNHEISFLDIERIIEKLMLEHKNIKHPDYEKMREIDIKTRQNAYELIKNRRY